MYYEADSISYSGCNGEPVEFFCVCMGVFMYICVCVYLSVFMMYVDVLMYVYACVWYLRRGCIDVCNKCLPSLHNWVIAYSYYPCREVVLMSP